MSRFRSALPQLSGELFLTEAGLETTLVFVERLDLPHFASFPLLDQPKRRQWMRDYYLEFAKLATRLDVGAVFESPTWRANPDWAAKLGYDASNLERVQRDAVRMLEEVRDEAAANRPIVISGNLGPRADGYVIANAMSADEAAAYHGTQIETFADTAADLVCAMTLNYVAEGVGIARAAKAAGMPVVLSYTVETDGKLPTGQSLDDAIAETDCETGGYPAYYMINCAHPTHFEHVLSEGSILSERVRGLRANASKRSHAELDEAPDLDAGDPAELGREYAALRTKLPRLSVLGGCCGTSQSHVEHILAECRPSPAATA